MFWAKPAWQRSLVIIAGVVVNLLVGIILFGVVYTKLGIPKLGPEQVMIVEVTKNSPAELADLAVGEVIVRVGDQETKTAGEFTDYIKNHIGESVSLYVAKTDSNGRREDSERVVQVIPRLNPPEGEGALGVAVSSVPTITYEQKPWYAAPYYGAVEGSKEAVGWAREFIRIFSHPVELLKNLSGPVAVVRIGQQAAAEGWITMVRFAAIISLNLGIFNILPIPALDGGRLLLVGLERIVGRKRVARVEKYINAIGMGLLILLLIGVTVKDLWFS
jgi:regulator of sigma E protease